jgi:hypothetical protein
MADVVVFAVFLTCDIGLMAAALWIGWTQGF